MNKFKAEQHEKKQRAESDLIMSFLILFAFLGLVCFIFYFTAVGI